MSSTEEDEFSLGGKRKANPQSYKRNVVKQARLEGEAYTNYSGKKIDAKAVELKLKIKSPHINDPAKRCAIADLAVHNRKSKKFYAALKEEFLDELKGLNNNVLSLSSDYMMNVSLPKVPVQDLFI
ncbi:hypothetical protein ANN_26878 [Periplaneta americana]|uniref:Uncharacterized protein n=1 Tax=Periplaneta americana TaxID=6978 RepID=A0ABQ8RWH9_PERAM|nr:hypothetical protein ANN_26878 [Periplaneta americana]